MHTQSTRVVKRGQGQQISMPPAPEGITIYCDAACEPVNPGGWLTFGWWACSPEGEILAEEWGEIGESWAEEERTNNVGEYTAALYALRWAFKAGHLKVTVRSDSQLLINQVTGFWSCNSSRLLPLRARLRKAAEEGMVITWEWIRRDANWRADELSRKPYQMEQEQLGEEAGAELQMQGEDQAWQEFLSETR